MPTSVTLILIVSFLTFLSHFRVWFSGEAEKGAAAQSHYRLLILALENLYRLDQFWKHALTRNCKCSTDNTNSWVS